MVDGALLSLCIDEYWTHAWEIKEDRKPNLDNERLHFDIPKDDLLDDSEAIIMVDTISSSHYEELKK